MSVSLVSGWFPVLVPSLAVVALLLGVAWRSGPARVAFAGDVVVAALVATATWWAQVRWHLVPYDVVADTFLWIGLLTLAVLTPVGSVLARRRERSAVGPGPRHHVARPGRRWAQLAVAVTAVPLALASTAIAVNAHYGYYPTLGSLRGDSALAGQSLEKLDRVRHHPDRPAVPYGRRAWSVDPVTPASVTGPPTTPPPEVTTPDPTTPVVTDGVLVQVDIPGPESGFRARTAWVWAPPSYVAGSVTSPPVVMLLSGSPGQTSDWIRGGNAVATAQQWATAHHGVAPLLVFPDSNGDATADTECVDSRRGNAETYLTRDVPTFLAAHFGTASHRWSVVGLSEGGECSAMLGLRHPDLFTAFADFSGMTSPTLTERVVRTATAKALFGGDLQAYDAHDPLWLLAHAPPRSLTAWFQTGADDELTRTAQRTLAGLATAAGLRVQAVETPGQHHDFALWSGAFAAALPTLVDAMTDVRGASH